MIGKRIKQQRNKMGYSISELAKRAGVSKSYLSYIERDLQNNPSLQFLSKIAVTLDTTLEYLLGEENVKRNEVLPLDDEWQVLLTKAIDEGMSKDEFREFREFIRFKNWKQDNR